MRKILMLAAGMLPVAMGAGAALSLGAAPAVAAPDTVAPTQIAQSTIPAELQVTAEDHVLGNADAPITIVEYASMTCGHCAHFHISILPDLKKKYIDTGKVRLAYRDYPLDATALQAAQIAECAGKERYFGVVDLVFQKQAQWAAAKEPIAELAKSLRIAGITESEIKACLANDKVATAIVTERKIGEDKLGVNSTPTLFINGELWKGERSMAAFDAAFAKLLK